MIKWLPVTDRNRWMHFTCTPSNSDSDSAWLGLARTAWLIYGPLRPIPESLGQFLQRIILAYCRISHLMALLADDFLSTGFNGARMS